MPKLNLFSGKGGWVERKSDVHLQRLPLELLPCSVRTPCALPPKIHRNFFVRVGLEQTCVNTTAFSWGRVARVGVRGNRKEVGAVGWERGGWGDFSSLSS